MIYCGKCHKCGTELVFTTNGNEWCPVCNDYPKYKQHGYHDGIDSPCKMDQPKVTVPLLYKNRTIEDILCYATLVAVGEVKSPTVNLGFADGWYEVIVGTGGCNACQYRERCLACIINE